MGTAEIERFSEKYRSLAGQIAIVRSEKEAVASALDILRAAGARRIALGDLWPPLGEALRSGLEAAGIWYSVRRTLGRAAS